MKRPPLTRELLRSIRRLCQPVPRAREKSENLLFCRPVTRQEAIAVQVYVAAVQPALGLREITRYDQGV